MEQDKAAQKNGRILYLCDPILNTRCKKTSCQRPCRRTAHKEYAQMKDGEPIIAEIIRRKVL